MAKARYSMGPLSVGLVQYDSVMTATGLVEVVAGRAPSTEEEEGGAKMSDTDKGVESVSSGGTQHHVFRVYRRSVSCSDVRSTEEAIFKCFFCLH